ncbi:MAG: hypothetical protein ACI9DH_001120 [Halioglobus sp.]|jgi:hypothetical protein
MINKMSIGKERRNYFRINDTVGLTYSTLEDGEDLIPAASGDTAMPIMDLLAEVDQNFNRVTNVLWHEKPAIAQALGLLNRKISIIAAQCLQPNCDTVDPYEDQMVNISGCGIAFHCSQRLPSDTLLKISTLLKPFNIKLQFTGKVIACEELPEGSNQPFWMRVSLDNDNAGAQEQLIQHIVQKQCSQIESEVHGREPSSKVF